MFHTPHRLLKPFQREQKKISTTLHNFSPTFPHISSIIFPSFPHSSHLSPITLISIFLQFLTYSLPSCLITICVFFSPPPPPLSPFPPPLPHLGVGYLEEFKDYGRSSHVPEKSLLVLACFFATHAQLGKSGGVLGGGGGGGEGECGYEWFGG